MEILRVNRIIDVEILDGRQGSIKSKIEDMGKDTLKISGLLHKGAPVAVYPGDRLRISIIIRDGMPGEGCYQFDTTVRATLTENIPLIEVDRPKSLKRIQRRGLYRLPILLSAFYRIGEGSWDPVQVVNISGGGVRLVGSLGLTTGQELSLRIDLDGTEIEAAGRVVAAGQYESSERMWYGIEFIGLDRRTEDEIIRFVFDRQRAVRGAP